MKFVLPIALALVGLAALAFVSIPSGVKCAIRPVDPFLPTRSLNGAGESMEPVLRGGEPVTYQEIPFALIRAGDIVVYRNAGGRLVAHAAIEREAGGWRVQGVNNAWPDSDFVTSANLVGVLVR